MSKVDFLRECMSDPALVSGPMPLDQFNLIFCRKCIRNNCSRAASNNMLFTNRANNWRKDLFECPPQADPDDKNYDLIRAKKFLPKIESASVQTPNFITTSPVNVATAPELVPVVSPVPPAVVCPPSPPVVVSRPVVMNTHFTHGAMIGGAPQKSSTKEVAINPGDSFVLGDSDE